LLEEGVGLRKHVMYGLGVHSEIPLWGDEVSDCPRDITVSWARGTCQFGTTALGHAVAHRPIGEIRLAWPPIVEMSILSGTSIVVRTQGDWELAPLRHLVSGIGLGLALHQRGLLTLHAAAIEIRGRAVAIAGRKGAGKSTLVAALAGRGHGLLSDDVVAVDVADDAPPRVRIGPPSVNLWPDAAVATGHDPSTLSQIFSRSTKLTGLVATTQPSEPVALGAIIVLTGEALCPRLEPVAPVDAFTQLVRHSHAFRWIDGQPDLTHHLAQCRTVLQQVPVFQLGRGESLKSLSALVERAEESVSGACLDHRTAHRVSAASPSGHDDATLSPIAAFAAA
jgi:hypothetical protein